MKRVINIILVISITLSFFVTYYFYQLNEDSKYMFEKESYKLFSLKYEGINFKNDISDKIKKYNLSLVIENYNDKCYQYYILDNNNLLKINNYSSKNLLSKKCLNYYNFDKYKETKSAINLKIIGDKKEIKKFAYILKNDSQYQMEPYNIVKINISIIQPIIIIIILFLIYYFVLTIFMYKNTNKISIRKLHGYDVSNCFIEVNKKEIFIDILLCLLTYIVLYIIFIRFYFNIMLLILLLVTLIISIILSILIRFYVVQKIFKINLVSLLKNKGIYLIIYNITNVINIILIIIILITGSYAINKFKTIYDYYLNSTKKWHELSKYYYIEGATCQNEDDCKVLDNNELMKQELTFYEYYNKKGSIYANFSIFERTGTTKPILDDGTYNVSEINENYLKNNKVYDVNNNLVKIDNTKDNLLIPKKYQNYIKTFIKENNNLNIIILKNNQEFFTYDIGVNINNGNYIKNATMFLYKDKIVYLNALESYNINFIIKDKYQNIVKKLQELKLNKYYDKTIKQIKEVVAYQIKIQTNLLIVSTITFIIILIISIILIFNKIMLYILTKQDILKVKFLNGSSRLEIFIKYITLDTILIVLVNIICLLIKQYQLVSNILMFSIIYYCFYLMISYIFFKKTYTNKLINILKGGN
ncbi:MAG: hypothetical protein LBR40_03095 [Bacilli bacterium]|jgi:hypothetical protein|nr:hypothetical protein [Bacilli bacterium]